MTEISPNEEMLFDEARSITSLSERIAFLDKACAGNAALRARLEKLLTAGTDADNFFADAALSKAPLIDGAGFASAEIIGKNIGSYKLLQKIGEGGCGVVYMAEQEKPVRRKVALKIIKLGMDTKSVIARFEAERQALAMMDHPNIARVLDAGTTDTGRPFFVMELVRGIKVTDYCDQNKLETQKRLDLFVQICQAIQHAHQKGIIHRDIKPSNILVTLHDGVPVPKVIDFGIAKAIEGKLTEQTLFTAYEQIVGTPAYMSPEQAEMSGLDIDTRTDIYSLGVLLYELLTGRTPFDPKKLLQNGVDQMRRTLREQEPQRPSTMVTTLQRTELTTTAALRQAEPPKLASLLRGDLDWIVMKCLEKDRRRRYETANGLAMDVIRYLHNEPIIARPPSRAYRFQKLVRRNKGIFAATGAVATALIIGFGVSTRLFFLEKAARQQAVAAQQQAEEARANEAKLRQLAETREKITQATVFLNDGRYDDADQLMRNINIPQPTVEGSAVFRSLGEWYAFQNQWKESAERFNVMLQLDQLDGWDVSTLDYLECGPALIESGNTKEFDQFRRDAVTRVSNGNYPFADRILKLGLLVPADDSMMKTLQPLAEVTAKSFATNSDSNDGLFLAAWRSVSMALWEYRNGNYSEAAGWSERCLNYSESIAPRTATARVILAMADQKLGKMDEARAQLIQARDVIEDKLKGEMDRGTPMQGFWFDWIFADILLKEAEVMIPAKSSQ